jgi:steroid 5-alpha reductase family enzyme
VFISYYQIILILWFSAPVYAANKGPLNLIDIVLAVLWLGLFLGEVTADQQQWNFQTEKYRLLKEHNNNK